MTIHRWLALLGVAFTVTATGCDDMLTESPDDFLTPDNFYRTAADAEAALISAYQPLLSDQAFGNNLWGALENGTDLARVAGTEASVETHIPDRLASTSESRNVTQPWPALYRTITRANVVIDRVPRIEMRADRQATLIAEAKFLRALTYFYLVRLYGDVPLITSSDQDGRNVARAPRDQVYTQVIRDATDAAAALPARWDAGNAGRPARGAALTLLADLYLFRGEWQKAADFAKQVIDSGVYSLVPNYLNVFLPAFENGPEHIFFLQASGETGETASGFLNLHFPRELVIGQGGGFGTVRPTDKQLNSFLPGDYRKAVSYRDRGCNVQNKCFVFDLQQIYKFRPTQVTNNGAGDVDVPIYRYAEVLLIYAEALNELNRTPEAVPYLNQIRARARRGTGTENRAEPANYSGAMSQSAVREAIFQERSWELSHEGKRWFDLVRRGEAYFMSQLRDDEQATDLEPTDVLWPIPQSEIDLNPALTQNPGY